MTRQAFFSASVTREDASSGSSCSAASDDQNTIQIGLEQYLEDAKGKMPEDMDESQYLREPAAKFMDDMNTIATKYFEVFNSLKGQSAKLSLEQALQQSDISKETFLADLKFFSESLDYISAHIVAFSTDELKSPEQIDSMKAYNAWERNKNIMGIKVKYDGLIIFASGYGFERINIKVFSMLSDAFNSTKVLATKNASHLREDGISSEFSETEGMLYVHTDITFTQELLNSIRLREVSSDITCLEGEKSRPPF